MSAVRNFELLPAARDTPYPSAEAAVCAAEENARRLWLIKCKSDASRRAYLTAERVFLAASGAEGLRAALRDYATASASISAFCASLAGYKVSTQRARMSAVRSLLTLCHQERLFEHPVAHLIVVPEADVRRGWDVPSPEKCRECIAAEPDAYKKHLLDVLYKTGMRSAELLGLEWQHVRYLDSEKGPVLCAQALGKGRKLREVALTSAIAAELEARRGAPDARVFPVPGGESGLFRLCQAAWARVGVVGLPAGTGPHLFRHAHCANALKAGATTEQAQAALGHADRRTTETYAHRAPFCTGDLLG